MHFDNIVKFVNTRQVIGAVIMFHTSYSQHSTKDDHSQRPDPSPPGYLDAHEEGDGEGDDDQEDGDDRQEDWGCQQ